MQTLQDLAQAFRLYAVCDPCARVALIDLNQLMAREGPEYPLERVRMRLKCTACQRRTHALRVVYVGPQGRASGFRYARETAHPKTADPS